MAQTVLGPLGAKATLGALLSQLLQEPRITLHHPVCAPCVPGELYVLVPLPAALRK